LRSRIVVTTTSSSAEVSATSLTRSPSGITPTVRAPPARAASATAPIMETLPPPETSDHPRRAIASPTSVAIVSSRGSWVEDAQ